MIQPPPPAPSIINLPALPPPPDYSTVNIILVALGIVLALTTVVLAVFAIVAGAAAIWGKSELKTMILAKASEVAETTANKRFDLYAQEQEKRATMKQEVRGSAAKTAIASEGGAVAAPYPEEGE